MGDEADKEQDQRGGAGATLIHPGATSDIREQEIPPVPNTISPQLTTPSPSCSNGTSDEVVAYSKGESPELAGLPTAGTEQSCTEQRDDFVKVTKMRSNDDSGWRRNTQMWRIPDMKDNMRLNGNLSSTTIKN